MSTMLTDALIEHILGRLPSLTIGVLGDLFLDRYLDIEASLTEKSIETGLDAYQVVRVRACPGALGTIINNLVALGVGRVCAVSLVGDDGEGYEVRQALEAMKVVDSSRVYTARDLRTPTYTKPMLHQAGKAPHELNRLDIKNRTPTPGPLQDLLIEAIHDIWPQVDALIVLDQVSEEDCGVVTARLREELGKLGESQPEKFVLADSRERIGLFRSVSVKPNEAEVEKALWAWGLPTELRGGGLSPVRLLDFEAIIQEFAKRMDRTVFCTVGEWGICLAVRGLDGVQIAEVGAYPVAGPIDPVGAGDSTSAGISSAVAAGASLEEAAAFGCLVASITIQQIGTTGTASADQVRRRWREVNQGPHSPSGRG